MKEANGSIRNDAYDAIGQVTRITEPNGAYLSYAYNDARRLTRVTNNAGEWIEYSYNLLGNRTDSKIKSSDDSIKLNEPRVHDELGRLLKTMGASSRIWTRAQF